MAKVEPPELTEARERLKEALALLESLRMLATTDGNFQSALARATSEAIDAARSYVLAPKIGAGF
jgi:hypothetical protein